MRKKARFPVYGTVSYRTVPYHYAAIAEYAVFTAYENGGYLKG